MSGQTLDAVASITDFTGALRELRIDAGEPSFAELTRRVTRLRAERGTSRWDAAPARITIYDAFRPDRQRLDIDLVVDLVTVLGHSDQVPRWRAAYSRILRSRAATARPRVSSPVAPPVIATTVRATAPLVGRDRELATLAAGLLEADAQTTASVLVTGLPGVGKTALAQALAARLAAGLPSAVVVEAALRTQSGDAEASHVPPQSLVAEIQATAARAATAEPRLVVMIDDAVTADDLEQVLRALPPGSRVIATSRRALSVPSATVHLELGPLAEADSLALLTSGLAQLSLTGPQLQEDLATLTELCGHLPLAIELLLGQVRSRPDWTVSDHVHRFTRSADDLTPGLTSTYRELAPPTRRALNLLALHPARLDDGELATLLAGSRHGAGGAGGGAGGTADGEREDLAGARAVADELTHRHLTTRGSDGRYDLHDTVRTLAITRTAQEEPSSALRAAVEALASRLLVRSRNAVSALGLLPGEAIAEELEEATRAVDSSGSSQAHEPPSREAATAWLEEHLEVLVTTAQLTAAHELAAQTSAFSWVLDSYLQRHQQRWTDALLVHEAAAGHGIEAYRATAIRRQASALNQLSRGSEAVALLEGLLETSQEDSYLTQAILAASQNVRGRPTLAILAGEAAVLGAREAGDARTELTASLSLTMGLAPLGRLEEARGFMVRSIELAQVVDPAYALTLALTNLAHLEATEGDWDAAHALFTQAVGVAQSFGHAPLAAYSRLGVLTSEFSANPSPSLIEPLEAMLSTLREQPRAHVLAGCLGLLADARLEIGDPTAEAELREILAISREHSLAQMIPEAEVGLGRVALLRGDLASAGDHFASALIGSRRESLALVEAMALRGQGDVALLEATTTAQPSARARALWQQGLEAAVSPRSVVAATLRARLEASDAVG